MMPFLPPLMPPWSNPNPLPCPAAFLVAHLERGCQGIWLCLPLSPPPQSHSKTTVLTVAYRFSKTVHFIPLPKRPSAKETADLLLKHVFRTHATPETSMVGGAKLRNVQRPMHQGIHQPIRLRLSRKCYSMKSYVGAGLLQPVSVYDQNSH